jgi:hypothetical protein
MRQKRNRDDRIPETIGFQHRQGMIGPAATDLKLHAPKKGRYPLVC